MEYQLGREDAGEWFPKVFPGRTALLDDIGRRRRESKLEGPCRFKKAGMVYVPKDGEPFSAARARADKRLAAGAKNPDPDRFFFEFMGSGVSFRIQEAIPNPLADPPPGAEGFWHPKIVQAYRISFGHPDLKGKTTFLGAYNCRPMRGSSAWSMHSNWPPVLAVDIGHAVSDAGRRVGDATVRILRSEIDGLVFVTWRDNSDHANHTHVQVGSTRGGTPVCA